MATSKQSSPKRRNRLFFALAFLVLLIVYFALSSLLEKIVTKELYAQLNRNPDSFYKIDFDHVNINVLAGNLEVKDLQIIATDSAVIQLNDGKINKLVNSTIPEFKIKGLNVYRLIRHKKIRISGILINNLTVDYILNTKAEVSHKKNTLALHKIFSERFSEAAIDKINIDNTRLEVNHYHKKGDPLFTIDSVYVNAGEILIDENTLKDAIPVKFTDLGLSTGRFTLNTLKNYDLSTDDVRLNVKDTSLVIEGFKLIPKYSPEEYNSRNRYNSDWFSINTQQIHFSGLSLKELEFNDLVSFHSAKVVQPNIEIYRDKRLTDAPFDYKPLLAGLIHKIPIDINIDTLMISEGRLEYREQVHLKKEPGLVYFHPFYISAYNISNNQLKIKSDPTLDIDFRGKIMGEAYLMANLNINLDSKSERFTAKGSLEPVSGEIFNPMIENLTPARIINAEVTKTEFSFDANKNESTGTIILEYDNLDIEVSRGKEKGKKSGFLSLIANGLIRDKNIKGDKKYLTGNIRFERRKDKALVNFLWNSIKSGIISIVVPVASKKDQREQDKKKRSNRK